MPALDSERRRQNPIVGLSYSVYTVPVCALRLFGLALLTQHGREPRELCRTVPIQCVVSTMIQDGASSSQGRELSG